jgi:vitellogenic carboxypeptidase-like protein
LVYNGNFDLILGPPLCEKFLKTLHWKGAATYEHSPKQIWKVDKNVAGYVRQALSFTQVIVLSAGMYFHNIRTLETRINYFFEWLLP